MSRGMLDYTQELKSPPTSDTEGAMNDTIDQRLQALEGTDEKFLTVSETLAHRCDDLEKSVEQLAHAHTGPPEELSHVQSRLDEIQREIEEIKSVKGPELQDKGIDAVEPQSTTFEQRFYGDSLTDEDKKFLDEVVKPDLVRRLEASGFEIVQARQERKDLEPPYVQWSTEQFAGATWNPSRERYEKVILPEAAAA